MFWHILGFLAILFVAFMTIGLVAMKRRGRSRRTPPSTAGSSRVARETYISYNALWLVGGWGFLYLLAWWLFPEWSRQNLANATFVVFALGFTLFGLMLKRDKPFRWKLAKWGMIIMVLATTWQIGGKMLADKTKTEAEAKVAPFALPPLHSEKEGVDRKI